MAREFLKTGKSTTQGEPTQQSGGFQRMKPPQLSRITGSPAPGPTPSSATGMRPSDHGAGTIAVITATPEEARTLRPFGLPEETTRSISRSLASRLVPMTTSRFSADGQFDGEQLEKFQIRPGWALDDVRSDREVLRRSLARSDKAAVVVEVAKLAVRTKMRVQDPGEARLLAETIAEDLSEYPFDVVRFACAYWIEGGAANKFFPSWPELKEICDKRVGGRVRLGKALAQLIEEAERVAP